MTIATGRSSSLVRPYRVQLEGVSYAILTSGAQIVDLLHGRTLAERTFDSDIILRLLKTHEGKDVMLEVLAGMEAYQPVGSLERLPRYGLEGFYDTFKSACHFVPDVEEWLLSHPGVVSKYIMHPAVGTYVTDVLQRIEEQGIPVEPTFSTANSLELSPKDVSKGAALVELCQLLGIPVEKGVAIGDSGNDLDMLRDAGLGIAMGNASSDVLAAADVVVADNDHGGCAEAIYTYLL
ncbi:HAD-IIB family hydrolase [Olsenella sp. Marseille-P4559]|uniref:HAD-IIB family hydrolase n=1 Tax=Olsenella sp. Marseille-P4559 TaxID=2364795 RepID=UPI0013EF157C|nr:HAD-IIB family hydrolase [Olsenella sp. Marseille-P4559]